MEVAQKTRRGASRQKKEPREKGSAEVTEALIGQGHNGSGDRVVGAHEATSTSGTPFSAKGQGHQQPPSNLRPHSEWPEVAASKDDDSEEETLGSLRRGARSKQRVEKGAAEKLEIATTTRWPCDELRHRRDVLPGSNPDRPRRLKEARVKASRSFCSSRVGSSSSPLHEGGQGKPEQSAAQATARVSTSGSGGDGEDGSASEDGDGDGGNGTLGRKVKKRRLQFSATDEEREGGWEIDGGGRSEVKRRKTSSAAAAGGGGSAQRDRHLFGGSGLGGGGGSHEATSTAGTPSSAKGQGDQQPPSSLERRRDRPEVTAAPEDDDSEEEPLWSLKRRARSNEGAVGAHEATSTRGTPSSAKGHGDKQPPSSLRPRSERSEVAASKESDSEEEALGSVRRGLCDELRHRGNIVRLGSNPDRPRLKEARVKASRSFCSSRVGSSSSPLHEGGQGKHEQSAAQATARVSTSGSGGGDGGGGEDGTPSLDGDGDGGDGTLSEKVKKRRLHFSATDGQREGGEEIGGGGRSEVKRRKTSSAAAAGGGGSAQCRRHSLGGRGGRGGAIGGDNEAAPRERSKPGRRRTKSADGNASRAGADSGTLCQHCNKPRGSEAKSTGKTCGTCGEWWHNKGGCASVGHCPESGTSVGGWRCRGCLSSWEKGLKVRAAKVVEAWAEHEASRAEEATNYSERAAAAVAESVAERRFGFKVADVKVPPISHPPAGILPFLDVESIKDTGFRLARLTREDCAFMGPDCVAAKVDLCWKHRIFVIIEGAFDPQKQPLLDFLDDRKGLPCRLSGKTASGEAGSTMGDFRAKLVDHANNPRKESPGTFFLDTASSQADLLKWLGKDPLLGGLMPKTKRGGFVDHTDINPVTFGGGRNIPLSESLAGAGTGGAAAGPAKRSQRRMMQGKRRDRIGGSTTHIDGMGSSSAIGGIKAGLKSVTAFETEDCGTALAVAKFKSFAKPGGSSHVVNDRIDDDDTLRNRLKNAGVRYRTFPITEGEAYLIPSGCLHEFMNAVPQRPGSRGGAWVKYCPG
eukprot:g14922.t1